MHSECITRIYPKSSEEVQEQPEDWTLSPSTPKGIQGGNSKAINWDNIRSLKKQRLESMISILLAPE